MVKVYRFEFKSTAPLFVFIPVSLLYTLSPLISVLVFGNTIDISGFYIEVELFYIGFITAAAPTLFYRRKKVILFFKIGSENTLLWIHVFLLLIYAYSAMEIFGGIDGWLLSSYLERTGKVGSPFWQFLYLGSGLLSTVSAGWLGILCYLSYCDNLSFNKALFNKKSFVLWITIGLFIVLGQRNTVLWSLSPVLILVASRMRAISIIISVLIIYVVSIIIAGFRNIGLGVIDIDNLNYGIEYADPLVHEFGTSYRIYELSVAVAGDIEKFIAFPGSTYLESIINFLPKILVPWFMSFSDTISNLYAPFGEGIGFSPLVEAKVNFGFFGIWQIGILSFMYCLFIGRVRGTLASMILPTFLLSVFNFWRIGFSVLFKIVLLYAISFYIIGKLSKSKIIVQ